VLKSLTVSLPEFRRCLKLAIEDDKKWPNLRQAEWLLLVACDWSGDKVTLNFERGLRHEQEEKINRAIFLSKEV
jgi:hypothetical protein